MKSIRLLFLLLISVPAFAQIDTLRNKDTLTEVVISGVRANVKDPISQSNLTKSDIQKNYAGQDFSSLIVNKSPSLTSYSDGGNQIGYQYLRMRGIDQTRINFTLNGVSLAEPEDAGLYTSNYTDFMSNIGSVQIQRGVGITPSGIGNLVGSVNFESPNLTDSAHGDVQAGLGSFNTNRVSVGYNSGVTKSGFAVYSRFSNNSSDGYRYNSGTNAHTFFTSIGYYAKNQKDVFKLTCFSGNEKSQMAYVAVSIDDINKDPRTNYLSPNETDNFTQNFAQLQHTHRTSENSLLTSSIYYIGLQGQYGVLSAPTMYNYALSSELYGAMTTWALIKNKFSLRVGANGYTYYRNHSMQIAPDFNDNVYSNRGYKNEINGFTKISYNLTKKLTAFGDLQLRTATFSYRPSAGSDFEIKPITWTFFNPKGGLTYQFTDKSSSFVSVGQMHREPTRNDMFAGFDNIDTSNKSLIGNLARIKPEQVIDYELGYRFVDKKFNFSTNAFYMQFKNQIAAIGELSYIGLQLTKNVASSYRYGIEAEYTYRIFNHFTLTGSGTWMKANIKSYTSDATMTTYTNITPLLTPQWIANQSISYAFFKNRIDITASARYISSQFLGNDNDKNLMVPQVLMFNGAVSIKPFRNFYVSLLCNNITNKRIYNSGYSVGNTPYYYVGATRNFYAALTYKF